MARVKTGLTNHKRHVKVLKLTKGYFGAKSVLYRTAHEQLMKGRSYAFGDRRKNKDNFRKLWITRINAAARVNGLSYSQLMHGLTLANITINRKVLSEIAISDPKGFATICDKAKASL